MTTDLSGFDSPRNAPTGDFTVLPHCAARGAENHGAALSPSPSTKRALGGMGTNGFNGPDAYPPFSQLSSLPEPGKVADTVATIEADLGTKAHGEPAGVSSGSGAGGQSAAYAQKSFQAGAIQPMIARNSETGSSGSSGQSYEEVVNGKTVRSKRRKSTKTKELVEKMKEVLRF